MNRLAVEDVIAIAVSGLIVGLMVAFVAPSDPWRFGLLAAWILAWVAILKGRRS